MVWIGSKARVVLLAVLLALVLVPVMLTFGSLSYDSLAERSEQQSGSRHQTVAILTQDAPEPSTGMHGEVIYRLRSCFSNSTSGCFPGGRSSSGAGRFWR